MARVKWIPALQFCCHCSRSLIVVSHNIISCTCWKGKDNSICKFFFNFCPKWNRNKDKKIKTTYTKINKFIFNKLYLPDWSWWCILHLNFYLQNTKYKNPMHYVRNINCICCISLRFFFRHSSDFDYGLE